MPRARSIGILLRARRSVAIVAATSLAPCLSARAEPPTLVFSSLCTSTESGDIGGERITIRGAGPTPAIIYEGTEGALMAPVKATRTQRDPSGRLRFELVSETSQTIAFTGSIGRDRLEGVLRIDGKAERAVLRRELTDRSQRACAPLGAKGGLAP